MREKKGSFYAITKTLIQFLAIKFNHQTFVKSPKTFDLTHTFHGQTKQLTNLAILRFAIWPRGFSQNRPYCVKSKSEKKLPALTTKQQDLCLLLLISLNGLVTTVNQGNMALQEI